MLLLILIIFIIILFFINRDCMSVIILNDYIWINIIIALLIFNLIYYFLLSLNIENFSNIKDNKRILNSIGICSKKCCPDYYNNNIKDSRVNKNKYLTTSFSCNDGIRDSGCVCLNKNLSNTNNNFLGTDK